MRLLWIAVGLLGLVPAGWLAAPPGGRPPTSPAASSPSSPPLPAKPAGGRPPPSPASSAKPSGGRPAFAAPPPPPRDYETQVAFTARRATANSRRSARPGSYTFDHIQFEDTVTDIGYGWYPLESMFICYEPGTYFFTFNALSTNNGFFRVVLLKNNEEIVSAWGQGSYGSASNSAILDLNQNDSVYLQVAQGEIHEAANSNSAYTTFSGYKIY